MSSSFRFSIVSFGIGTIRQRFGFTRLVASLCHLDNGRQIEILVRIRCDVLFLLHIVVIVVVATAAAAGADAIATNRCRLLWPIVHLLVVRHQNIIDTTLNCIG